MYAIQNSPVPPSDCLQLTRTALVERFPQAEYIYGRWDAVFGAWKRTDQAGIVEFVPSFAFQSTPLFGEYIDGDFWHPFEKRQVRLCEFIEEYQDLYALDLMDPPDSFGSPEQIAEYLSLIPQHIRSATSQLGSFSWLGLEACWFANEFADWLLRSRWHGRLAASAWHLSGAWRQSRTERRALVEQIMSECPTKLMSAFMPRSHARRYVSMLMRLRGKRFEARHVQSLTVLARDRSRMRTLSHIPDIQIDALPIYAELPAWVDTPQAFAGVTNGGEAALELLNHAHRYPQFLDKSAQLWIAARLKEVTAPTDIAIIRQKWDKRIATLTPFPVPPVTLPSPFEPVDTFEKLQREGRTMENCAVNFLGDILSGETYLYHWRSDEPATVRIQRSSAGSWALAEVKAFANEDLSTAGSDAVCATLRTATIVS